MSGPDALAGFGPATRTWFERSFPAPTPAQTDAWATIRAGRDTLVIAPTGSGKTLAAFLWAIDRLVTERPPACSVLYISPLRALASDVERNLRAPLAGITAVLGEQAGPGITVGVRTSDTPAGDRRKMAKRPPDILITTPESLYLMLTSQAAGSLRDVRTVIVDEVHSVAGTKRGSHLGLSLARLDLLTGRPAQRIGLSATVTPVEEVARFLRPEGPVAVVRPQMPSSSQMQLVVPVPDMDLPEPDSEAATPSIWPAVQRAVLDLVEHHGSTIVFTNSRRVAERLSAQLNTLAAGPEGAGDEVLPAELMGAAGIAGGAARTVARAHHGSVSKSERAQIEDALKRGDLPAVVATSSLELGIDMGAIDLMVQVGCPPSVTSGLQRLGRAGHQLGATSRGVFFPTHRGDLLATAVTVREMAQANIEPLTVLRHPLDVLAQQIVAMVSMADWTVDDLFPVVRSAPGYVHLPESAFRAVLDMLSGRYPSDDFAQFRPLLTWDRTTDVLSARPGAQRVAITSGGTIPDRGLFPVFITGTGQGRVGELDEEMVYESRVGDVISLGASSWRLEEITHDRVLVSPAPGRPGKLPFWHGDALGRSFGLSQAIGRFLRELEAGTSHARRSALIAMGLDDWAADNLLEYLAEQIVSTGAVPTDRRLIVERFRDEVGDWRVVLHAPVGARVTAAWSLLIETALRERFGLDAQVMPSDDGIVLRLPDTGSQDWWSDVADLLFPDPDELPARLAGLVTGTALFASRFRECSSRSLLLRRRMPGRRTPLWQQRQRSAQLLSAAAAYQDFPMVLETVRECLEDVYDLPALHQVLTDARDGAIEVLHVPTSRPSPFARTQLFSYVAAFLYESDNPLTERAALALELDHGLLSEILGHDGLVSVLPENAVAEVAALLQWYEPAGRIRGPEDLADLLRHVGPQSTEQMRARSVAPEWVDDLLDRRRAVTVYLAGAPVLVAIEDCARLRDALGVAPPPGVPDAFLEPVADPLGDLVTRYARTHGPFTSQDLAVALGLGRSTVESILHERARRGLLRSGPFLSGRADHVWVDLNVLARIKRRAAALLRGTTAAIPSERLAGFLPRWQSAGAAHARRGPAAVAESVAQLAGYVAPAGAWEGGLLPARVADYSEYDLDRLLAAGELVWSGTGPATAGEGSIAIVPADAGHLLPAEDLQDLSALSAELLAVLDVGGGWFFRDLASRLGSHPDSEVESAMWDLVWRGLITNDTFEPIRRLRSPARGRASRRALPTRTGPPTMSGRWSRLIRPTTDPTRDGLAWAQTLLSRYGVVTRASLGGERVPGGFHRLFGVFQRLDDAGRCQQVYVFDGLGGAQFALPTAVARLQDPPAANHVVLPAVDPANPFGAILTWPEPPTGAARPSRRRGGHVLLGGEDLLGYVDRGGRTLVLWSQPESAVATALVQGLRFLGVELRVRTINGISTADSSWTGLLRDAGLSETPSGLRLRSRSRL